MNATFPSRCAYASGGLLLAVSWLFVFAPTASAARRDPTSKVYVCEVDGTSTIDTGGRIEDLTRKSVYNASGAIFDTKGKGTNSFVFSNGSGAYLEAEAHFQVDEFRQEPFAIDRTDLETEPSISHLNATLVRGTLALSTSKQLSGSSLVINTPQGSINIRGDRLVIQVTGNQTLVSLLSGDVTVLGGPRDKLGQTLKPGQQAIIPTGEPGEPGEITVQDIPPDQLASLEDKATMADIARRMVYFDSEGGRLGSRAFLGGADDESEIRPVPLAPTPPSNPTVVSPAEIPNPAGGDE